MSKNVQAFPVPAANFDPSGDMALPEEGMALRDYFAAQALIGLLASTNPEGKGESDIRPIAATAYKFADAMLAEKDEQ